MRKKWATSFPKTPGDKLKQHPSNAALWRYIYGQAVAWDEGGVFSPFLTIWVDEGSGQWTTSEDVDIRMVDRGVECPPDYDTEGDHPECPPYPTRRR